MLLLPPDQRDCLLALLAESVPDAEVWAYGSRVKGSAHPGSDLDLVVRSSSGGISAAALAHLRERIQSSDLPILVDVHDWATIPAAFREEIIRNHVVLMARPSHHNGNSSD